MSHAIVAVLAGGRGRRLGGAKPTQPFAGRPLICHVLAAADESGSRTVVVAKPDTPLPALSQPVLREQPFPRHPLCGVLAALDHAATPACAGEGAPPADVVVVACDMPFLSGPLLAWLAGLDGAVMARTAARLQPLLARIPAAHRASLAEALEAEISLTAALLALDPRIVDERELSRFGDPERLCFSVDDREALARAEAWR